MRVVRLRKRGNSQVTQKIKKKVFFAVLVVRRRRYEMEFGYVVAKENTGHVGVFGVSHGHNADSSC